MIDHTDLSGLRRDADRMAWFLNICFWDGVEDQSISMTEMRTEGMRRIRWTTQ